MSLENNQQNNDINTKSHHAGNAPEHMREVPQEGNDFDNTSLREAVDRGLVDTEHKTLPKSWAESHPETKEKGFTRKRQFLAGMAATALALGIGVGANAMNSKDERVAPVTPVATAERTPSVAPVAPEVTATPEETINAEIAANVELNENTSAEVFSSRPRDEQLAFVWDKYNLQISDGISSEFLTVVPIGGSQTLDKYNPAIPGNVSTANNGQEIVNQNLFAKQYAAAQPMNPEAIGSSTADHTLETKLLAGPYYYANQKEDPTGRYTILKKTINNSEKTQLLTGGDALRVDKYSTLQEGVDKNGQAVKSKEVWVNSDGNTEIQTYIYHTFVAKDGQEHSIWLLAGVKKP